MAANRRLQFLAALLVVVLVGAMVVRSMSSDPPAPAARQQTARQSAAQADVLQELPDVKLEALAMARETPGGDGRDPFRFRPRPAPAAPEPKRIPGVPDDQVGAPPPRPSGPPPPPPITLKFIGLVEKADGTRIAVLSDGKRPIHGVEGEEIEGRYKILKIGTESLEIAYIDGRGRQTIRLTGQ
jgi:hypothetical protein